MSLEKAIEQLADAISRFTDLQEKILSVPVAEHPTVEDKPRRGRKPKVAEEVVAEEVVAEEVVAEEVVAEEVVAEEVYYVLKQYELSDIQKALMKIAAKGTEQRQAAKGIPLSLGYAKSAEVPPEKYADMVKGIYMIDKDVATSIWG